VSSKREAKMEDPYRPTQLALTPPARVLAGPNRLRTLWHLTLLLGLLGVATWAMTTPFGHRMPWLVGLLIVPVTFDLVRTVQEALLPHRVTADSRGIELAWAEKAAWRPWMRRRSVAIAWDELLAVRTATLSVNGLETTDLLIDRKLGPTVTIPHGTFGAGADAVQQAILDEREDRIEAPRREAADVAGFCSERFTTPRTFRLQTRAGARLAGTLFAVLMITVPAVLASFIGWAAHLGLTAPGLLVGSILLYAAWTPSAPRVLRLQAEGMAHGATEAQLELVPWSQVRFARPALVNGEVVTVRVALQGGRALELRGDYGVPLAQLAAMIAPPAQLVMLARERPLATPTVA
jgi:hypothetical protein